MTIYKSSFNKKEKQKPKKKIKERVIKTESVKTKKKINVPLIVLLVSTLVFIICIFPNFITSFMLGVFGLSVYPVSMISAFFGFLFLTRRRYGTKKRYITYLTCALIVVWFVFHLILTSKIPLDNYGQYLLDTYKLKITAGGLIFSLISYPLTKYLTYVGAYIVSVIAFAIFIALIIDYINVEKTIGHKQKPKFDFSSLQEFDFNKEEKPEDKLIELSQEEIEKNNARKKLGLDRSESTIISTSMPSYEINLKQEKPMSKKEYILTPLDPVIPPENSNNVFNNVQNQTRTIKSNFDFSNNKVDNQQTEQKSNLFYTSNFDKPITQNKETEEIVPTNVEETNIEPVEEQPKIETELNDDLFVQDEDFSNYETAFELEAKVEENKENEIQEVEDLDNLTEDEEITDVKEIDVDSNEEYIDEYANIHEDDGLGETVDTEVVRPTVDISKFNLPNMTKKTLEEPVQMRIEEPKVKEEIPPYVAPPVEILKYLDNPVKISDEELQDNIIRLEQVLEDFKVPAKVNNVQVGPAVTRYELSMPRGISVSKIATMSDDIAMTLASNGAIRVEAPIPGKNAVGIEVPNKQVSPVSLRELVDSEEFRVRQNPLSFVLGKDINGDIIFCNLDKMPHVLVAGSTGSGKSVCLNTMLLSMCYKAGPQDLRLILIDPKMVEFATYNGLPHLLIPEVITNKDMAINALDWAIKEMERRYTLFAKNHVVNINEFNKLEIVKNKVEEKLPFIVVVVDELADLMIDGKRELDDRIAKIAAKARAAGIHLVLATQRPSVDVITGTIKANLPSRIAFALTNYMDSKTILDAGGAEKLLGKGDMLFKPQDKPEPRRIQGAYVSNEEIAKVVEFIKNNNKPVYDEDAGETIKRPKQDKSQIANASTGDKEQEFDSVLKDALKWFIQVKQASASMIARRFSVGFNRAGRIMDQMEDAGFISRSDGSKPRAVLITMEEYNQIFGEN